MTSATASSSLRSLGAARRASVPNEARADAPKPTPATTVPAAASATIWISSPTRDSAVPTERLMALITRTLLVGQFLRAKAVRAPAAHRSVTTKPPIRWLLRPNRLAATEGPGDDSE